MLLSEFTERTGITPEYEEWQAITTMYMLADVDKDEFCKLWCKMNAQRVKTAKEQKAKEEKQYKAVNYLQDVRSFIFAKLQKDSLYSRIFAANLLGNSRFEKVNKCLVILGFEEIDMYDTAFGAFDYLENRINEFWDKAA